MTDATWECNIGQRFVKSFASEKNIYEKGKKMCRFSFSIRTRPGHTCFIFIFGSCSYTESTRDHPRVTTVHRHSQYSRYVYVDDKTDLCDGVMDVESLHTVLERREHGFFNV